MIYSGFSTNGMATIVANSGSPSFGQRDGLSEGDIVKLNQAYNCPPPGTFECPAAPITR